MELTINVPIQMDWIVAQVAERLAEAMPVDRRKTMVARLGEACSRETAAKEIEVSVYTIGRMLEDGRLKPACAGSRVDVRSLAEYIERRPEADHEARMENKRKRRKQ